jgi:LPXTG-motif cell wall-anchored protein
MNNTLIQAIIWLSAGGAMVLFLKRRKARRTQR